jgi:hypothetical protein
LDRVPHINGNQESSLWSGSSKTKWFWFQFWKSDPGPTIWFFLNQTGIGQVNYKLAFNSSHFISPKKSKISVLVRVPHLSKTRNPIPRLVVQEKLRSGSDSYFRVPKIRPHSSSLALTTWNQNGKVPTQRQQKP